MNDQAALPKINYMSPATRAEATRKASGRTDATGRGSADADRFDRILRTARQAASTKRPEPDRADHRHRLGGDDDRPAAGTKDGAARRSVSGGEADAPTENGRADRSNEASGRTSGDDRSTDEDTAGETTALDRHGEDRDGSTEGSAGDRSEGDEGNGSDADPGITADRLRSGPTDGVEAATAGSAPGPDGGTTGTDRTDQGEPGADHSPDTIAAAGNDDPTGAGAPVGEQSSGRPPADDDGRVDGADRTPGSDRVTDGADADLGADGDSEVGSDGDSDLGSDGNSDSDLGPGGDSDPDGAVGADASTPTAGAEDDGDTERPDRTIAADADAALADSRRLEALAETPDPDATRQGDTTMTAAPGSQPEAETEADEIAGTPPTGSSTSGPSAVAGGATAQTGGDTAGAANTAVGAEPAGGGATAIGNEAVNGAQSARPQTGPTPEQTPSTEAAALDDGESVTGGEPDPTEGPAQPGGPADRTSGFAIPAPGAGETAAPTPQPTVGAAVSPATVQTTGQLTAAEAAGAGFEASALAPDQQADGTDPLWQQVRRALGSLRNLPSGEQQLTIRLRPAELGSVVVRINTGDNGTQVSLVTESSAASNQLNQQRQQLLADLEESGLTDVNVDINAGSDDRTQTEVPEGDGGQAGGPALTGGIRSSTEDGDPVRGYGGRRSRGSSVGLIDLDL